MSALRHQSGFTLGKMLFVSITVGLLGLLTVKLTPEYLEYYKILQAAKAVAAEARSKPGITVMDIRQAFDRRANIDSISGFTGKDLDISKEGNEIVVEFSYQRIVPMFGHISILIDFEGSSAR